MVIFCFLWFFYLCELFTWIFKKINIFKLKKLKKEKKKKKRLPYRTLGPVLSAPPSQKSDMPLPTPLYLSLCIRIHTSRGASGVPRLLAKLVCDDLIELAHHDLERTEIHVYTVSYSIKFKTKLGELSQQQHTFSLRDFFAWTQRSHFVLY